MVTEFHLVFCKGMLNTMDDFTDHLISAAEKENIDYYLLELNHLSSLDFSEFFNYLEQKHTYAILLNNIGIDLEDEAGNIWQRFHIPVYDFIQDHPQFFKKPLANPGCDARLICLDRNHIKFIRKIFPNIEKIHFMPNGGYETEIDMAQFKNRPIDVLYTGNCQLQLPYPAISFFDDGGQFFYETVVTMMLQSPYLTTENAIDIYFRTADITVSEEEYRFIMLEIARYIETNIRRYFKLQTMHALDNAGIIVDVYGANWEDPGNPFSDRIRFHGRIDPKECNELPKMAKISLNCMPWFKDGCSERVFNNMLSGSVSITDTSNYLLERFQDGKEVVFYELNNLPQLAADILYLQEHAEAAEQIARCGLEAAQKYDTWHCRFCSIMNFIKEDEQYEII